VGETAHVHALGEMDVSSVTPGWAPGVLHDPVLAGVSHSQDTVVKTAGGAAGVAEDTSVVELPSRVGVDTNGYWAGGSNGVDKGVLTVGRDGVVGADGGSPAGGAVFAGVGVSGLVWVGSFGVDTTVGLHISEGRVHETTAATIVSIVPAAIAQILFAKADQLSGGTVVGGFHGSSSGEGPARSTASLVLYWGDGSLVSPVNAAWGRGQDLDVLGGGDLLFVDGSSHLFKELRQKQIPKVVHLHGVGFPSGFEFLVVLVDLLQIVSEDLESEFPFQSICVGLLVGGKEIRPFPMKFGFDNPSLGECDEAQKKSSNLHHD